MRNARQGAKSRTPDVSLYRAFLALDRHRRKRVALRILGNQRLLADLYDHFLIEQSTSEAGRSTPWRAYRRSKNSPRR